MELHISTEKPKAVKHKMKYSIGDRLISIVTYAVYALFSFLCVYPFYYIFINSISANDLSDKGKVLFLPLGIHFSNYVNVLKIPDLFNALKVSMERTIVGTVLTVLFAAFLGFMFTRETLWHRKFWYRFVIATMYFNAGIIPWYITMKNLGLTNNFWGYIWPVVVQPFYIVLCKTFVESTPKELQEAAEIDGAGTLKIFFRVMLPIIKPILATIAIFAAVAQWNSFQDTLLLVTDNKLFTLQFVLYQYINQASSLKGLINILIGFSEKAKK
jgi:ABC-type glycerol-3-phosphate transport system permease component